MVSSFSPPLLDLTDDDDDDHEIEQNIHYGSSLTPITNENLPRKKRKLTNTNVCINPSIINWSKRQRNDHYQYQPITHNSIHHQPGTIDINPDDYSFGDQQSHSFHAFDWTTDLRAPPRIYSNPIQTASRVSMVPPLPPNAMNVVKHHLDQSDTVPLISLPPQNDRYMQHSQRKSSNIPIPTIPPQALPLPLPTPTSSLIRPHAQRIPPGKNIRIPYIHTTPSPPPPPPTPLPVLHKTKPVFPSTTYHHPLSPPPPISTPISTPEIRRQALHGTGTLSAFYDSQCYRCNICKFKTLTSSTLLQHLFTHTFFCHQCPFYSNSHHSLYQHIFEKHNSNHNNYNIDPKNLDLLYITRCSDGTFALCMDSSPPSPPPPPPSPPPPPPPPTATKTAEKPIVSSEKTNKPKTQRKRPPKQKKDQDNDIVVLLEKRDINPKPSSSAAVAATAAVTKCPIVKEKPTKRYILMKHRCCYAIRLPPCLHALTLEYNICREHTIRQMCHTQGILKRRKFKPKSDKLLLIDEAANCLKTVVNHIVDIEENRDSSGFVYALPNNILNLIFPTDDLYIITNSLKLNNKYDKSIEQNKQNQLESSVRKNNQHIFLLSSPDLNKNEQSLHPSVTNTDSIFTHTKLNKLPISYDNTHRFLKGNLNILSQPTNSTSKPTKKNETISRNTTSPIVDKNNNSILSSKSRLSPTPTVIVID